jgi:hypothetical protein
LGGAIRRGPAAAPRFADGKIPERDKKQIGHGVQQLACGDSPFNNKRESLVSLSTSAEVFPQINADFQREAKQLIFQNLR